MKKFGLTIFSMAIGFLGAETSWAAKKGATEGTATVKCVKYEPNLKIPGKFTNVPTPVSISDFDYKCNTKFSDCQGSCAASTDTDEAIKNRYLKEKIKLNQKNNKQKEY